MLQDFFTITYYINALLTAESNLILIMCHSLLSIVFVRHIELALQLLS